MIQVTTISEMRAEAEKLRKAGKTIGFVPTMGALHEGHMRLVRASVSENDVTVCSIFVNPTQFNNADDFRLYPRIEEQDALMLEAADCDILFLPSAVEMYPAPAKVSFDFGELETVMEGAYRPGHFNGVALVVSKFFHLVQPHRAYFGQKDLQQYAIIRQMVTDLNFNLDLVRYPIVREDDGLAMSSRNRRLTENQRMVAPKLYEALVMAKKMVESYGAAQLNTPEAVFKINAAVAEYLSGFPEIRLEYFEIANAENLQPENDIVESQEIALCLAAYVGEVRLIDNIVMVV